MVGPEDKAREGIDAQLAAAGWHVCDVTDLNISAHRGIAVREFPLPGHGFADYLLYISDFNIRVDIAWHAGGSLLLTNTEADDQEVQRRNRQYWSHIST
jgi:type I restriction enzyme R subunit